MSITSWTLPELLETLHGLARNYWWSWSPDGDSLFRDLDPELWESSHHNPRRVLEELPHHRLTQVATDPIYLQRVEYLSGRFRAYMSEPPRNGRFPDPCHPVAYFCAEFGIHESLPIYAGGLGVLAGDHLKSASDLGLPLVAVGLLYREGYFRQSFSVDGGQLDYFITHDFDRLPISRVTTDEGIQLEVRVPLPGRDLVAAVWRVDVGRVRLYLLDADVDANTDEDRRVTARLYGGDWDTRICQEILLGIGGVRLLRALGITPSVYHLNEGHSSFLTLELARELIAEGLSFAEAREEVRRRAVFTTHTPVPAGNDEFSFEMMDHYFGEYWPQLGLSREEFLSLGSEVESLSDAIADAVAELRKNGPFDEYRQGLLQAMPLHLAEVDVPPFSPRHVFGVTPLAIRMCRATNGVSLKHGEVSRAMWHQLFPDRSASEVPIRSVTNGIHLRTWISPMMWVLFDRYFGEDWTSRISEASLWERLAEIPDAELWRVHQLLKDRLVSYSRHRLAQVRLARGDSPERVAGSYDLLDPRALTIGFARRFAAYKRGDLLFHDPERLAPIFADPDRPVQILFAGKAHPNDLEGKQVLRRVVEWAQEPRFKRWIVFLEDYDLNIARHLVRGVDVWLNNPRRPLEASGTSGQKVAVNGGINLSVLDGWWCEGFTGDNGWPVGGTLAGLPPADEDELDAASLYDTLTTRIIPLFFDRGDDGVPHGWVAMMKRSIQTLAPMFNTDRMVSEYAMNFYVAEDAVAVG
jgi:starch phosphorylase